MTYSVVVASRPYERYRVYSELLGKDDGRTVKELVASTRLSKRAVIQQLKRLRAEGVVVRVPPTRGSDRRRHVYRIGAGWTYRAVHEQILRQASLAVSDRLVSYPESAGYILSRGPGEPVIYVDVLTTVDPTKAESYLPTPVDFKAYRAALSSLKSTINETLREHRAQWPDLLRQVIVEIASSQDRPFFLLAYPHRSLRTGKWPDHDWRTERDRTISIPRSLFSRFHTHEAFPRCGRSATPILSPAETRLARRWASHRPPAKEAPPTLVRTFYDDLSQDHAEYGHPTAETCDCFHRVLHEKERRRYLPRVGRWSDPRLTVREREWATRRKMMRRLQSIHDAEGHFASERCRCWIIVRIDRELDALDRKQPKPLPHSRAGE